MFTVRRSVTVQHILFLGLGQMALRWVKRTFFDGTNLAQNSFDSRDASFWTRFRETILEHSTHIENFPGMTKPISWKTNPKL